MTRRGTKAFRHRPSPLCWCHELDRPRDMKGPVQNENAGAFVKTATAEHETKHGALLSAGRSVTTQVRGPRKPALATRVCQAKLTRAAHRHESLLAS